MVPFSIGIRWLNQIDNIKRERAKSVLEVSIELRVMDASLQPSYFLNLATQVLCPTLIKKCVKVQSQFSLQVHMSHTLIRLVVSHPVWHCLLSYNTCSTGNISSISRHVCAHGKTLPVLSIQWKWVYFRVCRWEARGVCNRNALLLSSPPLNLGASPLPAHQD